MIYRLRHIIRRMRHQRGVGVSVLLSMLVVCLAGNTLTFFFFERLTGRDVGIFDSLWYSMISISTIGYGDFSAISPGARLGTMFFIVIAGLTTFTAGLGIMVDWILDFQYKERAGMGNIGAKGHLLIVNFPSEARVRQVVDEFRQDTQHHDDEIVIVTDQIETLPPPFQSLSFVRGSPLEEDTYHRANVGLAKQAIVLSPGYDNPNSDSVVASVASIIEYLNPAVRTIAECLSEKHAVLFAGAKRVSLVHTLRLANNLLVQEAQDPGVNLLTQAVTSNRIDGTLASTRIEDTLGNSHVYLDIAKKLLDEDINLIGVIRDGTVYFKFGNLTLARNDSLVYISTNRYTWESIRLLLGLNIGGPPKVP